MRIGRFPVQTLQLLSAQPGLETQLRYEAPGNLRVKIVENAVISIGFVRMPPQVRPKVGRGTVK